MRNVRNRAPARNHYSLPLWRSLVARMERRKPSYAVRKLGRYYPDFSPAFAALKAELNGYPREED